MARLSSRACWTWWPACPLCVRSAGSAGRERTVRELGERNEPRRWARCAWRSCPRWSLELLATLCVALVAVSIGLRLVFGEMSLMAGVFALILAPEVYQPLRAVGAQFHAAEQGVEATSRRLRGARRARPRPSARRTARPGAIELRGVALSGRDGAAPSGFDGHVPARPGRRADRPERGGQIDAAHRAGGPDGARCRDRRRRRCAAAPAARVVAARRVVPAASVPGARNSRAQFHAAGAPAPQTVPGVVAATGLDEVVAEQGWYRTVGTGGAGLSAGQRQRAGPGPHARPGPRRAAVRRADRAPGRANAARVLAELRARAAAGALVVIVGHDEQVLAAADEVLAVARA